MARKAFAVNDAMREKVRYLAGVGVPQDDIAKIVGCAPKTLRKRCRNDLDRGIAEANATMCGYLFAAAKGGKLPAIIFFLKTRAHWREKTTPAAPASGDGEANASVLILPDNGRDPELTEVLRDAQQKYFARKPRQQTPELTLEPGSPQTENTVSTLPDGGPNPLFGEEGQPSSAVSV